MPMPTNPATALARSGVLVTTPDGGGCGRWGGSLRRGRRLDVAGGDPPVPVEPVDQPLEPVALAVAGAGSPRTAVRSAAIRSKLAWRAAETGCRRSTIASGGQ